MLIHTLDPIRDSRWTAFLDGRSDASVFQTVPWLTALRKTYGYQPIVYTSTAPDQALRDGIVLCRVESWLTGRRLVSLPFSDYCDPLLNDPESGNALFTSLRADTGQQHWRYVEIRPSEELDGMAREFVVLEKYCLHKLDLSPSLDTLFSNLHKDCVQRKIKRAQREGLTYSEGRSEILLSHFYQLLMLTRRRHRIPPQPMAWYRNLIESFGESLKIRVAYNGKTPVASILTLQDRNSLVFKYGCADPAANNLGGTHLLLWKSIQEAKASGLRVFDLGRTDTKNAGLITFKERWGATRSVMTYWKYSSHDSLPVWINMEKKTSVMMWLARQILEHAPSRLLSAVGSMGYRHVG
jgi:CelD/BcsL family acetyltransferase involved in cellulose biosynthesis